MTNATPREQRAQLFEIDDQDAPSPFMLAAANGWMPEAETPRQQRAFLFEIGEQDAPSPYTLTRTNGANQ